MIIVKSRDILVAVTIVAMLSLLTPGVKAPDPGKDKRAGYSKYGATSSRSPPYNVRNRRHNDARDDSRHFESRRHSMRTGGAAPQRTRALDPPTVQYPIPTFLTNPSLVSNPLTLYVSHIDGLPVSNSATAINQPNVIGAVRLVTAGGGARRWDNPNPVSTGSTAASVGGRRVGEASQNNQLQTSVPTPVSPPAQRPEVPWPNPQQPPANPQATERRHFQDLSVPPPPTWQPFLRDLVMTLGYREAVSAWPRLARHTVHNFTEEERERQGAYMEQCRNTLIGFEG